MRIKTLMIPRFKIFMLRNLYKNGAIIKIFKVMLPKVHLTC